MISFRYQFSVLTVVIALVHLTLETLFTVKFGQTFAGYLPPDCGCVIAGRRISDDEGPKRSGYFVWCMGVCVLSSLPRFGVAI